jgi:7-cyano-7-deazaguanine reductase
MTDYSKAKDAKIEIVKTKKLITFPSSGHQPMIEWQYPEFQCLCPVSERHDQGIITIRYMPNKEILESKSVREYLSAWRNLHIWQEFVTEEIANALNKSCKPLWLEVEIEWSSRGGIYSKTISRCGERKDI